MSRVLLQGAALLALLQGAACFAGKTAAPTKASKESGLQCLDHKDNDGDGKADCQDPDCMNDPTYGDVCFSFYGPCSLNGIRPNMLVRAPVPGKACQPGRTLNPWPGPGPAAHSENL